MAIESGLADEEPRRPAGESLVAGGKCDHARRAARRSARPADTGRSAELTELFSQHLCPLPRRHPDTRCGNRGRHDVRSVTGAHAQFSQRGVDGRLIPLGPPQRQFGDRFGLDGGVDLQDALGTAERRIGRFGETIDTDDREIAALDAAGTFRM